MNIREFRKRLAEALDQVVATGEPLPVNNWNKPHVVVVSAERWKQAEAALAAAEKQKQEAAA